LEQSREVELVCLALAYQTEQRDQLEDPLVRTFLVADTAIALLGRRIRKTQFEALIHEKGKDACGEERLNRKRREFALQREHKAQKFRFELE